jgi:hypothetical protein
MSYRIKLSGRRAFNSAIQHDGRFSTLIVTGTVMLNLFTLAIPAEEAFPHVAIRGYTRL